MTAEHAGHVAYPWPQIDVDANQIVVCVGRKGSGKSAAARMLYGHWPGADRVVIDVNGDADPGPDAKRISGDPPAKLPEREHGQPVNLWYVADPMRATYRDDLDRAVRLALFPRDRRTVLWVDEIGEVTQVNKTPPHLRTLLQQSRHFNASAILCGPRPVNIDSLCIAQADRVLIFDLPNPNDRARVADVIGWPPGAFDDACRQVRREGRFWFLMYVAAEHELYLCPPLPKDWLDIPPTEAHRFP